MLTFFMPVSLLAFVGNRRLQSLAHNILSPTSQNHWLQAKRVWCDWNLNLYFIVSFLKPQIFQVRLTDDIHCSGHWNTPHYLRRSVPKRNSILAILSFCLFFWCLQMRVKQCSMEKHSYLEMPWPMCVKAGKYFQRRTSQSPTTPGIMTFAPRNCVVQRHQNWVTPGKINNYWPLVN